MTKSYILDILSMACVAVSCLLDSFRFSLFDFAAAVCMSKTLYVSYTLQRPRRSASGMRESALSLSLSI